MKEPIGHDNDDIIHLYPNANLYPDFTGEVYGGGNVKYLLDYEIDSKPDPIELKPRCFAWMFYNYSYEEKSVPYKLMSVPGLPSEKEIIISDCCYEGTFNKCQSLTIPPKLPNATAYGSYSMMFSNSGVIKTPKFPTSGTSPSCYLSMFENCYNLKSAEELPSAEV